MLSRHFLRVKVLQSLYAYIVTENSSLDIAEKELDKNEFDNKDRIGIMAGASTPKDSIDEVKKFLENI